jgi:hypothetical protein
MLRRGGPERLEGSGQRPTGPDRRAVHCAHMWTRGWAMKRPGPCKR